ncbi:MAG: tetratricopeptide repeat protein [Waddliaceae bacterium]
MSALIRPLSIFLFLLSVFLFCGCHPKSTTIEPHFTYLPRQKDFESLPKAFSELSQQELEREWGKELKIGIAFARELDLYRAITAFKRSLVLMPPDCLDRQLQTSFYLVQSYYLGGKHDEAIAAFASGPLPMVCSSTFPAFRELMIILYDAYRQTDQKEKAQLALTIIESGDSGTARDLALYSAIDEANFSDISTLASFHPLGDEAAEFLNQYTIHAKSVSTARTLNALIPGAGYYYVGQKTTALTSFTINTAFIAAAYYFFKSGNWGAGLITTSLEFGWYFGGINGAGLAAKEYNTCLYREYGKILLQKNKLFPVLMFNVSF